MRLLAPSLLLCLTGCGPDLLLPHFKCCEANDAHRVHAHDMDDTHLLRILEKPDRLDLSACWREAERRGLIRLFPPRNGKHARLVHDEDVSQKTIESYLAFKRTESERNDAP